MKPTTIVLGSDMHPHASEAFPYFDLLQKLGDTSEFLFAFPESTEPATLVPRIMQLPEGVSHRIIAPDNSTGLLEAISLQLRKAGHILQVLAPNILEIQIQASTSSACRTSLA